jgi:multiple sugar transport system ATP-binding protein
LELYNTPANRFVAGFIGSPGMNFAPVRVTNGGDTLWAEGEGIRIKVPGELKPRLARYTGSSVTLGVRPEDMRVANGGDSVDSSIDAAVEVIEKLGSEILLDVKVGPTTMVAAVEPTVRAKVHDRLRLALNPDRLHFFDDQNEAAI